MLDKLLDAPPHQYSPLWMVTQEPKLNAFVAYLSGVVGRMRDNPEAKHELTFTRDELRAVRRAFGQMILRGEAKLHRLCDLLCGAFFATTAPWRMSSVVIGEVDATKERFVLSQGLTAEDLFLTSDLDLGTRQLAKLRFLDNGHWCRASLVANFVEYQPTEANPLRIHKIISRIKAEEEIWNKVVDEIFDLDGMLRRDKQMSHLSAFVKDVFGLKIVVESSSDIDRVQEALMNLRWTTAQLAALGVDPATDGDGSKLEVLEVKDYIDESLRKQSGWEALKSVVRWCGKTFEIQIQPQRNYFREQEYLTRESHAGFKARRELVREEVAAKLPLFGFCQALLKWLFMAEVSLDAAPQYPGATIRITD